MSTKEWGAYFNAIKKQDWERALEFLNSIIATERKNPLVHLKIGDVSQKIGDIKGALTAYHQSARLFMNAGFLHKGLATYKIILRLNPNDDEAINRSIELLQQYERSKTQIQTIPSFETEREKLTKQESEALPRAEGAEQRIETGPIPSLFASLPEKERKQLLDRTEQQVFSSGHIIIEEGDFGDSIFILKSGRAKVVTHILGKEIELATLSSGDTFGEVAFLTGRPRTASVIAIDTVEVIEFNRVLLEDIFEKNPEISKKLHDFYQCRVQDTLTKVRSEMK
jgi:tetratricopeptide (TPR) repeat protein